MFSAAVVMAQKYTAKPKPRKSDTPYTQHHNDLKKCMAADLTEIQRFDNKAKNKVKRYLKFLKDNEKDKSKRFTNKLDAFRKYFNSDKYKAMKAIYKKCDKEVPWPWIDPPFWIPADKAKRSSAI